MNAFDRERRHNFHTEEHRADRRVFAARSLSVAVAPDDDTRLAGVTYGGGTLGERRFAGLIETLEHNFRIDRDVAAVLEVDSGGHDVIGRDLVADLDDHNAVEFVRQRLVDRRRADGALAHDLAGTAGELNHVVVDLEHFRFDHMRIFDSGRTRIGEFTGKRDRDGGLGADQIGLVALRAGASSEVAVESADRYGVIRRTLPLPDARAAAGLKNARPGGDDVRKHAVAREHFQHLPAARSDRQRNRLAHLASLERHRDHRKVAVARVRAGADQHLADLFPGEFADGLDVVGTRRAGRERLDLVERDLDDLIVFGVRVGRERDEILFTLLRFQENAGRFIRRENARGHAEFRAHVRDRRALRDRESRDAGAEVFDDRADVPFRGQDREQFQNHVFCGAPRRELPGQLHADHFRVRNPERLARHRERHIEPARADREHADAAARRRMRIRADQRPPRHPEPLQMHLVADAVARRREADAFRRRHALQIEVVVAVLRSVLHHIVVDVGDREFGLDFRNSHRLKFEVGHRAGRVLRQRLVDPDRDGLAGFAAPLHKMRFNDLLYNGASGHDIQLLSRNRW